MPTIHRIWLGPNEMPEDYVHYGELWKKFNPEYDVKLWTEPEIEAIGLQNRAVWDHLKRFGGKSDIPHRPEVATAVQMADVAAYEIIHRFGGVYVNCDMEPLRPISELPVGPEAAWACVEIYQCGNWAKELVGKVALNNGALGGPAGHPFWQLVIDELPYRFDKYHPDRAMHEVTGPYLLTLMHLNNPGMLCELPRHFFNYADIWDVPVGGNAAAYRAGAVDAGAFVLHHWGHRRADMRTDT